MIKRVYCKSNFRKDFKKGEIYEACRSDDDFTGDLEIFTDNNIGASVKVVNGELVDQKYFKLIRSCREEYICKGTWGMLLDC